MSKGSCEAAESTVGASLRMARLNVPLWIPDLNFLEEINHESIWCE